MSSPRALAPVGVTGVIGHFDMGDVVSLLDHDNVEFAKGIPNYNSGEINIIKGLKTSQVEKALGYIRRKEVMEHKNMYVMKEKNDFGNMQKSESCLCSIG